jgi:hypothetical protein
MCAPTRVANTAGNDRLSQRLDEWIDWSRATNKWDHDWLATVNRSGGIDALFNHRMTWVHTPGALPTKVMHLYISKAIFV